MSDKNQNGTNRWAMTLLTSIFITLIGLGLPSLFFMGRQIEAIQSMKLEIQDVKREMTVLFDKNDVRITRRLDSLTDRVISCERSILTMKGGE